MGLSSRRTPMTLAMSTQALPSAANAIMVDGTAHRAIVSSSIGAYPLMTTLMALQTGAFRQSWMRAYTYNLATSMLDARVHQVWGVAPGGSRRGHGARRGPDAPCLHPTGLMDTARVCARSRAWGRVCYVAGRGRRRLPRRSGRCAERSATDHCDVRLLDSRYETPGLRPDAHSPRDCRQQHGLDRGRPHRRCPLHKRRHPSLLDEPFVGSVRRPDERRPRLRCRTKPGCAPGRCHRGDNSRSYRFRDRLGQSY